ncbi:putative F-box/LRR-repeat protein 7 [Apostichopus japonicus]|uniref:Putative F-box/LRR-repeat protein 7 n=1 Tax=Stichopus japonicus TaxID=307972 RepID=A0A2G8KQ37_STIJA|nr:putative F-box/LRR-repeat protein 7 [Apostichopus japonicus]
MSLFICVVGYFAFKQFVSLLASYCKVMEPASSADLDLSEREQETKLMHQADQGETGNPRKVFVGNICYEVRSGDLKSFLKSFGDVKFVQLLWDKGRRRFKGSAFVTFCSNEGAVSAKSAPEDARTLNGRVMTITAAEGRRRHKRQKEKIKSEEFNDETPEQSTDKSQVPDQTTEINLESLTVTDAKQTQIIVEDQSLAGSLPDDILLSIFSSLQVADRIRVERVCKRWRHAALLSWQGLKCLHFKNVFRGFFDTHVLTHRILKSILQRGCHGLQSLDVSASPKMLSLAELLSNYRSSVNDIVSTCDRKNLLLNLAKSKEMCFANASIKHEGLLSAGSSRVEIHGSKVEHTSKSDYLGVCIDEGMSNLTDINLSGMRINNHSLQELSKHCIKLKKVQLRRCYDIGEKGFWWLFKNCPDIEYFDGRENMRITGQCFHLLNPACHTVLVDDCSNLSDMGMKRLTDKCPKMKTLSISKCFGLTGDSICRIAELFTSLEKLYLIGDYPSVPSGSLYQLGMLPSLEYLHLRDNLNVSDISGCYKLVTTVGILVLGTCTALEDINISYIDKVTDDAIETLAINCPLRRLIARTCPEITDQGLISLANHCLTLSELDVSGCEEITDKGAEEFARIREEMDSDVAAIYPTIHLTLGGTSVSESFLTACHGRINMSDLNLSVPQKRLQLEECAMCKLKSC